MIWTLTLSHYYICITYVQENDKLTINRLIQISRLLQKSSNVYKIYACCGMFFLRLGDINIYFQNRYMDNENSELSIYSPNFGTLNVNVCV